MHVEYPTAADLEAIHDDELDISGGSPGLRDRAGLESAAMRPRQTFGGADLYPTLCHKAAALFESLICNHPFVDGNKRTATTVAIAFLEANGLHFEAGQNELVEFAVETARGQHGCEDIAEWFQSKTVDGSDDEAG